MYLVKANQVTLIGMIINILTKPLQIQLQMNFLQIPDLLKKAKELKKVSRMNQKKVKLLSIIKIL